MARLTGGNFMHQQRILTTEQERITDRYKGYPNLVTEALRIEAKFMIYEEQRRNEEMKPRVTYCPDGSLLIF